MKVSKEQMGRNRTRILDEAGRLFRERGFASVSVSEVMKAAGLTHGGFYGHFKSKDELIAQVIANTSAYADVTDDLCVFFDQYLSTLHRDHADLGCPTAAFAGLMRDQSPEARAALASALSGQIQRIADGMPNRLAEERRMAAIGSFAAMVGAVVLARAIDDTQLSGELLSETRAWIDRGTPPDSRVPYKAKRAA